MRRDGIMVSEMYVVVHAGNIVTHTQTHTI